MMTSRTLLPNANANAAASWVFVICDVVFRRPMTHHPPVRRLACPPISTASTADSSKIQFRLLKKGMGSSVKEECEDEAADLDDTAGSGA